MVIECAVVVAASALLCAALVSRRTSWMVTRHVRDGERIRRGMLGAYATVAVIGCAALCLSTTDHTWQLLAPWIVALVLGLLVGNLALISRARIQAVAPARPKRVLAIGAHPDDLELACGGTLARMVDMGHDVHSVVMSRGGVGGVSDVRVLEAHEGALRLGVGALHVHDFPDTNLALTSREMTLAIERDIAMIDPDIILTHSSHDQHQDHAAVHQAVLRAARKHHSIMCFESPSVTPDFNPTVFFDVSDYIDIKQDAVLAHQDQIQGDKVYMGRERLQGMAVFRGGQVRRRRAEGFEVVRLLADEAGVF